MEELKQRILDIIHKPQLAALATVTEQNNPWVRYVVTVGDGEKKEITAEYTRKMVTNIANDFRRDW